MYVEALFDVPLGAESLFSTKCLVTSAGTQVTSEEGGEGVAQTDHSQRWFQWENTKVPYWNRLAVEIKLLVRLKFRNRPRAEMITRSIFDL